MSPLSILDYDLGNAQSTKKDSKLFCRRKGDRFFFFFFIIVVPKGKEEKRRGIGKEPDLAEEF